MPGHIWQLWGHEEQAHGGLQGQLHDVTLLFYQKHCSTETLLFYWFLVIPIKDLRHFQVFLASDITHFQGPPENLGFCFRQFLERTDVTNSNFVYFPARCWSASRQQPATEGRRSPTPSRHMATPGVGNTQPLHFPTMQLYSLYIYYQKMLIFTNIYSTLS